jgi:putative PIN family toxin of toxin-antitoxin system
VARVVLDTNVVVSACLTPGGAAATIVELALLGTFTLCISPDVLDEYREVLARTKFSRQHERIKILLDGIADVAVMVAPKHRVSILQDYEDNRFLECAVAAEADFLVTGNLKHFPAAFKNVRMVSPRDFLVELDY